MQCLSKAVLCATLAASATAQFALVAPNGYATTTGNSNNAFPWNRGTASMRIQFLYDSTNFTLQGVSSPIIISRLRYRTAAGATSWSGGTWPNVQIDMSSAAVDYLTPSSTFAANHGPNLATVLQGPVTVQTGTGVGTWYIDIPLTTPFVYDPTTGTDLCLDIILDGTGWSGTSAQTDSVSGTGAGGPALMTRIYDTSGITNPGGTIGTNYGAVCEFTYVPATGLWPSFTATPRTGSSPLNVQFTDQTYTNDPGGVLAWQWDFDGDSIIDSSLQNPSFTYTNCGSYNVSLTAIDGAHGPVTITRPNYIVTDSVNADFTYSLITGTVVQFTDSSTPAPTSWAWDFDGDSVIDSTLQNPVFVFPASSSYSTTLTVSRLCGPPSTVTKQVRAGLVVSTLFTGGNGGSTGWGVLFDCNVGNPTGIVLTSMEHNISSAASTPFTIDVYITPATYVGVQTNAAAWRLVASGTGVSAGANVPSPTTLNHPVYLAPGNYGMMVFYTGAGMSYTNGNGSSTPGTGTNQTYGNSDLTLLCGESRTSLWGTGVNTPRVWNGSIFYDKIGFQNLAGYTFFQAGCAGTAGMTNLVATNAPVLGQTMNVTLDHLAMNLAVMVFGFSRTNSAFGPLPFDLGILGAPGCQLRVSNDANFLVIGAGGLATWNVPIPNNASLTGILFYNQAFVLDSTANALGAVLSDAAAAQVGM